MGLKIDGIATSEHIDSSGELLIVENHDIADLIEGKGVMNWEHSNKGEDIIGAIIYARKILKREDCENDRQRKYWDYQKKPFVYVIGEMYEDEDHPGAVAVSAMIRYYAKKGEKLLTGFSIEGATLERRDYILQESVGRRVAVTLRPCNHTAIAGLYDDPKTKKIAKSIEDMSKSIDASLIEIDSVILEDEFMPEDPVLELHKALEELNKTLEAGMGNVAPSQLTGQAALTREHISGSQRNRLKAVVRDWDRKRPLKEVVKAALPEVSDEYVRHFADLAEELSLKKARTTKLIRVGASHSPNKHANDDQKKLVEGLYFDQKSNRGKDWNPGHGEYTNAIYKLKNDAGQNVLVKNPRAGAGIEDEVGSSRPHDNAQSATHYYHLANEVFGLGKHVPVTNYFKHPDLATTHAVPEYREGTEMDNVPSSGKHHQAMEIIPRAKVGLSATSKDLKRMQDNHSKTGDLHKLMMMDTILGNIDRHDGNYLIHPKGHVMNIDNDMAFSHSENAGGRIPDYIGHEQSQAPIHEAAAKWVSGLDPRHLAGKMLDQGHDTGTIKASLAALKMFQKMAERPNRTSVQEANSYAASAALSAKLAGPSGQKKAV